MRPALLRASPALRCSLDTWCVMGLTAFLFLAREGSSLPSARGARMRWCTQAQLLWTGKRLWVGEADGEGTLHLPLSPLAWEHWLGKRSSALLVASSAARTSSNKDIAQEHRFAVYCLLYRYP